MAAMELLVIGHKNPDTDASTAAAALAALINELGWFGDQGWEWPLMSRVYLDNRDC